MTSERCFLAPGRAHPSISASLFSVLRGRVYLDVYKQQRRFTFNSPYTTFFSLQPTPKAQPSASILKGTVVLKASIILRSLSLTPHAIQHTLPTVSSTHTPALTPQYHTCQLLTLTSMADSALPPSVCFPLSSLIL